MSFRRFNPRRDALPALHDGWLRSGERPIWADGFNSIRYAVEGRKRGTVPKRHPVLRVARWALYPYTLSKGWAAGPMYKSVPAGPSSAPEEPVAFGSHPDCEASQLAGTDVNEYRAFWVLTDHRFAGVTVESVPTDPASRTSSILGRGAQIVRELGQIFTGTINNLPPEPVRLRTLWELRPGQYSREGPVKRGLYDYHRVTFADGSGIDFPSRPER
ncbi:hypothetical protein [Stackebrandtia nassauensis]|uniref:Uncharacterized protein n=1 Tax=Stackebrandtia nassauensis (strain DSM 44728 / CIP 108903 / NRRL B-16338 / NBRC 102104 / LLR-40K-21) TaxID=446470 RepID=D3Q6S6_STANL|nr:hypothetical protein [Stackebrandtia nassauensis]ADD40325.1 hypothetical protein Snas_0611 [Stackebrandtia nassauensis DSM 44728]